MTIALWPEVPTGGVPQRMSLACDQADELAALSAKMTANAVSARLSMAFPSLGYRSLTGKGDIHPGPRSMLVVAAHIASMTKASNRRRHFSRRSSRERRHLAEVGTRSANCMILANNKMPHRTTTAPLGPVI